jgi:hypothetical protein
MDAEFKKDSDDNVGMNSSTVFNMSARAVLGEKRLLLEVTVGADPLYRTATWPICAEAWLL